MMLLQKSYVKEDMYVCPLNRDIYIIYIYIYIYNNYAPVFLVQQFNRSLRDYAWKILKIKLSNHGMWDHNQVVSSCVLKNRGS